MKLKNETKNETKNLLSASNVLNKNTLLKKFALASVVLLTANFMSLSIFDNNSLAEETPRVQIMQHLNNSPQGKTLAQLEKLGAERLKTMQDLKLASNKFVGKNRYETNAKTLKHFQNATGVIIADGNNFADSLSAISLIRITGYPLILTNGNQLSSEAQQFINQDNIKNIFIVGGKVNIEQSNNKLYKYFKGKNRYETNQLVKDYVLSIEPNCFPVLVDANNYPDSLSASNILLNQHAYLEFNKNNSSTYGISIGGKIASANKSFTNISGKDRYETNQLVIDKFKSSFLNPDQEILVNDNSFADALSACNLSLLVNSPIKLHQPNSPTQSNTYEVGNINYVKPKPQPKSQPKPVQKFTKQSNQQLATKSTKQSTKQSATRSTQRSTNQSSKQSAKRYKYGDQGRLFLPSINTSVALYDVNIRTSSDAELQRIVDNYDSAMYSLDEYAGPGIVIGDHRSQSFKNIGRIKVGQQAFIENADGSRQYYKCISIDRHGRNTGDYLLDSDNVDAWTYDCLTLYACNDWDGVNVTLVRFVRI